MRFCRDKEQPDHFWVDRSIDDKAEHFLPCPDCFSEMGTNEPKDTPWFDFDMCYECDTRLDMEGAIQEVKDERPYIMDRPFG